MEVLQSTLLTDSEERSNHLARHFGMLAQLEQNCVPVGHFQDPEVLRDFRQGDERIPVTTRLRCFALDVFQCHVKRRPVPLPSEVPGRRG